MVNYLLLKQSISEKFQKHLYFFFVSWEKSFQNKCYVFTQIENIQGNNALAAMFWQQCLLICGSLKGLIKSSSIFGLVHATKMIKQAHGQFTCLSGDQTFR